MEQEDLFAPPPIPGAQRDGSPPIHSPALGDVRPLAEQLRPRTIDEIVGQDELIGPNAPLGRLIRRDQTPSMMLWGPPGSGKTTLARVIAEATGADFVPLSAVTSGVKEVRSVVDMAKGNRRFGRRTVLFIDEIHRFNRAQQDALLPHVEEGLVTLIGATTENPSFSVVSPLLSRCRVFVLAALTHEAIAILLRRGIQRLNEDASAPRVEVADEGIRALAALADGDGRRAIGMLEIIATVARTHDAPAPIGPEAIRETIQRHFVYDRSGEEHFNLISALHKTLRSSDPHGALYWLGRMLGSGEDPRYVARRMIRFATEDIGLAEPNALLIAMEALRAYESLGSPEGELALAECCVYLALAPKSNSVYRAWKAVRQEIGETGTQPVPLQLRNAPTGLMKQLGYGASYTYDHDAEGGFSPKVGLPEGVRRRRFFEPAAEGWEGRRAAQLAEWDAAREALRRDPKPDP